MIIVAAMLLAACDSKTSATPTASTAATPTGVAVATTSPSVAANAHFVTVPPGGAKLGQAQTQPWVDVVAFHEVGLRSGETVTYQVSGSATASYTCNGKAETAAGTVGTSKTFSANASGEINDVIAVLPPRLQVGQCSTGYPNGIWGFRYGMLHLVDTTNQVTQDVPGNSGGA